MKNPPRIYKAEAQPVESLESRYSHVKEIRFKSAKNGQKRATYYSKLQNRWFPIPVAAAELLVAGGFAEEAR